MENMTMVQAVCCNDIFALICHSINMLVILWLLAVSSKVSQRHGICNIFWKVASSPLVDSVTAVRITSFYV